MNVELGGDLKGVGRVEVEGGRQGIVRRRRVKATVVKLLGVIVVGQRSFHLPKIRLFSEIDQRTPASNRRRFSSENVEAARGEGEKGLASVASVAD